MGFGKSDLLHLQQTHWNLKGTFHCGTRLQNCIQDITWKDFEDQNSPPEIYIFVQKFKKRCHVYSVCYFHFLKTFDTFLNIVSQLRRIVATF